MTNVLTLPYRVARVPLKLLDSRLALKFGDESTVRLTFERVLASLDITTGRLLHDPQLQRSGERRARRTDKLAEAAGKQQQAAELRTAAQETVDEAKAAAATKRRDAAQSRRTAVQQAAQQEKRELAAAAAKARKAAAQREKQVDDEQKQQLRNVQAQHQVAEAAVEADLARATAEPQAALADAVEQGQEAAGERRDADALDALADQAHEDRTEG